MNTRLQVEHPVTEEVTGLDLVALQIKVAEGETLGLTQDDVTLSGHSIEVRLYAEDPTKGFLPSTGTVACFEQVARDGVRYDTGIRGGQEISPFYDPMIAKLITTGPTREAARKLMVEALTDTALFGPKTNRDFLIACLEKDDFISGDFSTAFIAETSPMKNWPRRKPMQCRLPCWQCVISFATTKNPRQSHACAARPGQFHQR